MRTPIEPVADPNDFASVCEALDRVRQTLVSEMQPTSDRQRVQRILVKLAEFRAAGIPWEKITQAVSDVGFRDAKGQPFEIGRLRQFFASLKGSEHVRQMRVQEKVQNLSSGASVPGEKVQNASTSTKTSGGVGAELRTTHSPHMASSHATTHPPESQPDSGQLSEGGRKARFGAPEPEPPTRPSKPYGLSTLAAPAKNT